MAVRGIKSIARSTKVKVLTIFVLGLVAFGRSTFAAPLSLQDYLEQVKAQNKGVKSSILSSQANELLAPEAQLLLAPTVFANIQVINDAKLNAPLFVIYDSQLTKTFSLGVSQLTTFGLSAKLHYDLSTFNYMNPSFLIPLGPLGGSIPFSIVNASPVLELSQNLWSNGFGRSTRAQQEALEAKSLATHFQDRFQAKATVASAESAYWRLALARQVKTVQEEALDRAKKIYEWNLKRSQLQLGDQSDVLQSMAGMQSRELELSMAVTEVRNASRGFNSARNLDSEEVTEELLPIDPELMKKVQPPQRAPFRDDVLAAKEISRAAAANSTMNVERDLPTLDLVASIALNGQQGTTIFGDIPNAVSNSFTLNRPTETIGIRFSAPLALGLAGQARKGWRDETTAAELSYERKLFEQEQTWKDLITNYQDGKNQLELSEKLEKIQFSKLENERERLKKGRTTTFQVLLFEQDYLLAELTRIRSQANILNLIAQMKLFGETL